MKIIELRTLVVTGANLKSVFLMESKKRFISRFWISTLAFIGVVSCAALRSFADDGVDLKRLTDECTAAKNAYVTIQSNFPYKVLHTVQYAGWIGDQKTYGLIHPVTMTLRYAGNEKIGYYWLKKEPGRLQAISAKTDLAGNVELVETTRPYTFHGRMNDGVIRGVWERDDGTIVYAFYVKAMVEK